MIRFALMAAALVGPAAALPAPIPLLGHAAEGQKNFMSDGCYQCHGIGAVGGDFAGPPLVKTKLSYEAFLLQLRRPRGEMPPYKNKILPDPVAADIYQYLESLPLTKPAASIPLVMKMGIR